jgi:hypothetical protein
MTELVNNLKAWLTMHKIQKLKALHILNQEGSKKIRTSLLTRKKITESHRRQ